MSRKSSELLTLAGPYGKGSRGIKRLLAINLVGVEKVTELTLVSANAGTYKQSRVPDARDRHTRRLAAYDGTTPPFGVAVLLLPH